MRSKFLPWMACALVALVCVPALAFGGREDSGQAIDGAFATYDNGFREVGQPVEDNVVNIGVGERVTFRSPAGSSDPPNAGVHNVAFEEDSPKPAECNQTVQSPGVTDPLDANGR